MGILATIHQRAQRRQDAARERAEASVRAAGGSAK